MEDNEKDLIQKLEDEKDFAYWERNMIVLLLANIVNKQTETPIVECGWYYDTENNFEGFKRVLSLFNGEANFHIPDTFDVGSLPEIQPSYDGHNTEEKYKRIMKVCNCKIKE